jgi:hypothetical protein
VLHTLEGVSSPFPDKLNTLVAEKNILIFGGGKK